MVSYQKNNSYSKAHFTVYMSQSITNTTSQFLIFNSCCRVTQTGNHRCRTQTTDHFNANTNIHWQHIYMSNVYHRKIQVTIIPTTYKAIKPSKCGIPNLRQRHKIGIQDSKVNQSGTTIHNTCLQKGEHELLRSNIPTSQNTRKAGNQ